MVDYIAQHIVHVVKFAFAVALRVVEPVIDQPVLIQVRVDINTSDHANPLDQG